MYLVMINNGEIFKKKDTSSSSSSTMNKTPSFSVSSKI